MAEPQMDVVTGSLGYSGRYITRRLLEMGRRVRTLTGHPHRPNPFGSQLEVAPLDFDQPADLINSLRGATTLYNTYWVRFSHGRTTFNQAVDNTKTLIRAACDAGVRRIVHVSITNPSLDSPLPYFRGKAILEQAVVDSGLSHAILRPTVIFGDEDILINNIAWFLRRFPLFLVPGDGSYRLQPIFVEDLADLAVRFGQQEDNMVVDAVGPDILTFDDCVCRIADAVGSRARIVHAPPRLTHVLCALAGRWLGDVVLTRDEIAGLMGNLLVSANPPTGATRLTDWLEAHRDAVGLAYSSELARHYR